MHPSPPELAEAFCRHEFQAVYPYLDEAVRWEMVGGSTVEGKAAVLDYCRQSAAYLADVKTQLSKLNSFGDGKRVAVDSTATYVDGQGRATVVASCDLFTFRDGLVSEIISYTIELGTS